MKPKIFYLSGCSTCTRIIKENNLQNLEMQDLRKEPLTENQLKELKEKAGSYEKLFSGRSMQVKARGIDLKTLTETDRKKLLLDHYSFLKRPVLLFKDEIFVGSSKSEIERLRKYLAIEETKL